MSALRQHYSALLVALAFVGCSGQAALIGGDDPFGPPPRDDGGIADSADQAPPGRPTTIAARLTLVAHYRFDEGSGELARDDIGDNHLRLNAERPGAAKYGWEQGPQAGALHFPNQPATWFEAPDAPQLDFDAGDFSVSFWVKKLATSVSWSNHFGVAKWDGPVPSGVEEGDEWEMCTCSNSFNGTDDFAMFSVADRRNWTQHWVYSEDPLILGNWFHLVGVRRGDQIELYQNGQLKGITELPAGTIIGGNGVLRVNGGVRLEGTHSVWPWFSTHASYDDLQIFRGALSVEQIAWMHDHPGQVPRDLGPADRAAN